MVGVILREVISASPFGTLTVIDKAVRRFNTVGAETILQCVGIVAFRVNGERAIIQSVNVYCASRRNRHAIHFSKEGVRRGDIIG